ncbi:MAG: UBP-type zinc finger domain-containing protein [Gemmatimonadetes bacterium]|nr:UBP-type zinc finger domain-containing protein [Gemmatimonadota bacterium]
MGLAELLGRLLRRPKKTCPHLEQVQEVTPSSPDGCTRCLEMGDSWVNLRICLTCGQVGCCDNSKNTHATKHFQETGHPIIQSFQPAEAWRYCYVDEAQLAEAEPFRA